MEVVLMVAGGDTAVARGKVQAPGADGVGLGKAQGLRQLPWKRKEGRWREASRHRQKMTSLLAATLGPSGGVAAGLVGSGGLGVALPCASAKRSRLLPEVFDDCSCVGRRSFS